MQICKGLLAASGSAEAAFPVRVHDHHKLRADMASDPRHERPVCQFTRASLSAGPCFVWNCCSESMFGSYSCTPGCHDSVILHAHNYAPGLLHKDTKKISSRQSVCVFACQLISSKGQQCRIRPRFNHHHHTHSVHKSVTREMHSLTLQQHERNTCEKS